MTRFLLFAACVGLLLTATTRANDPKLPDLFTDDFSKGADNWEPKDPKAWKVVNTDRGSYYSQFGQSNYKGPHRSPFNMCLFFGYQDPAHLYYVHMAKQADDHANQIFIVNAADRVKISTKTTKGTAWDDNWHHVKVVRTVADGKIEIYFDDMKTPIMTATDKTFTWGQVGIGSFDDTGNWKDVTLRGTKVKKGG